MLFILQQGHNFQCHRSTPSHKYRYFVRAFLWVDAQPPGAYHDSAFLELKVLHLNNDDNFCAHSNFPLIDAVVPNHQKIAGLCKVIVQENKKCLGFFGSGHSAVV